MSGDPMEYTNWREGIDNPSGIYTSLLGPTYAWNIDNENGGNDNGVICEIRSV